MDQSVLDAVKRWPDVPVVYGWLSLTARGEWKLHPLGDAQLGGAGQGITNTQILGFIGRNYASQVDGAWFFQNGPQRVYVELEATPFIARTDPAHQFVLHDGEAMTDVDDICLTDKGQLVLSNANQIAMLDDRDLAQCLPLLKKKGHVIDDSQLMQWLDSPDESLSMTILEKDIPVRWLRSDDVAARFGFIKHPLPL